MPLNAGTVESDLIVNDRMSPAMQLAAARVQELEYKLGTLGANSVAQFNVMNAQLAIAQERFDKLAAAGDGATASATRFGQASITTAQGVGQLEGIATRMIERFLILAAVRGSVQLVEGLFETADALVKTADNLDITTTKLQIWEFAGDKAGVSTATLTGLLQTLNKKMAAGSDSTVSAIDELGLSYEALWQMDPATRFETVVNAIGHVEDGIKRAGLETDLFGTDKIDGLVRHFEELTRQAEKSGTVMGPETVRQLSGTWEAYKETGKWILAIAADWLAAAQNQYAYNQLQGNPQAQAYLRGEDISGNDPNAVANTMADSLGSPKGPALPKPLANAPYDPNDKAAMAYLNAAAAAEAASAREMIAAEQAAEKYAQAWEKAQKQTEDLWTKDAQAFETREKQKATLEDNLAKQKEQLDIKDLQARLDRGAISEKSFYTMKASIEKDYYEQHNDTLKRIEQADLESLQNKEEKELNALEDRYARGLIDEAQYQEQRAAITETYANMRLTIEDKFANEMEIRRKAELQKELEDAKAAAAALQKQKADQAAADAAAKKKQENLDTGGSFTINKGNLDQNAAYWGIPADAAEAMAKRGFSFQEILAAWQSGHVADWVPAGPRIPGFREGGGVDIRVGETGPEVVRVPIGSSVTPYGGGGGSGSVVVTIYAQGLLDPATIDTWTDKISRSIIKESRLGGLYGSR